MSQTVEDVAPPSADDEQDPGHQWPQDVQAEQCVLGAMMMSREAIGDVLPVLKGPEFYRAQHRTIYETVLALYGEGVGVDPVTVAGALSRGGSLALVGGVPYLHAVYAGVPTASNAAYYADRVRDLAIKRRTAQACEKGYHEAMREEGTGLEVLDRVENSLADVRPDDSATDYLDLGALYEPTVQEVADIAALGGKARGVPTGFVDFDELTNGLHGGQLILIAARPAVGKSTLAMDFARHAAIREAVPTLFFSLEMSRVDLTMRLLAAEARVPLHHMLTGTMTDDDWQRLAAVRERVTVAPMAIDDSPNISMPEIRAKARRYKQRHGLGFVVLDYLQLMQGSRRDGNRQQEVSEFSRSLKLLAKELDVPIVALSQLNRGPEQRSDKKPMMSDLRESGALEQDADMVLLLHREDMYEKESPRAGEADIIVAKHRNGPTATITVAHQGHYSRFVNMQQ